MTKMTRRIHIGRAGMIALLVALSAGCTRQQLTAFDARLQEMTGQAGSSATVAPANGGQQVAAPHSLDAILADLQRGEYRQGRRALERYLERHPDDAVAQGMLRQLTADPESVLGEESHRYVIQPGDSYSALADRHLGDSRLFLLLARYNQSSNPSALRVGQEIRLPAGPPSSESMTTSRTVQAGSPARRSFDADSQASRETAAAPALPDTPLRSPRAGGEKEEPSAEALQRRGLALLEQGEREEALRHLEAALQRDASLEPAASRAPELRESLVEEYHQRAILRYRNQKLDDAIDLWNRVLAIDPTFEPARSYRARALELQSRLEDL